MKKINRLMTNICSYDLEASKAFYTTLFDFEVGYDSDWFINLISKDSQLELGIISAKSDIVPAITNPTAQGFYITFIVEDADKIHELAVESGFRIEQEPHDTFYGQRRLLLKDPNGVAVDVSAPIADFDFGT